VPALAGVLVLGLGGAGWFYTREFFKPRAAAEEAGKKEATVELEPFVVNLAGENSAHYLRASLSLVLKDERDRQSVRQLGARIRHGLIMLLSGKTADRLLAAEGKTELAGEIAGEVNRALGGQTVAAVYFREFLIQ